jgi:hypothetical protein
MGSSDPAAVATKTDTALMFPRDPIDRVRHDLKDHP